MKCSTNSLLSIIVVISVVKHMSGGSWNQAGGARLSSADRRSDATNNSFPDTTAPKKI